MTHKFENCDNYECKQDIDKDKSEFVLSMFVESLLSLQLEVRQNVQQRVHNYF